MCGIAGRFNFDGSAVLPGTITAMTDSIVHRGPDDSGQFVAGNVGLGMRRLSIIDIASGHQPIFNEDHTVCVVYNGEIYNYKELTEELLRRGHKFSTHSDTEILVHFYEDEGIDFLKRLNGMFAFALWDAKLQKLFLVRDRVGIKPLSYYRDEMKIVFASEIKAILTNKDVDTKPNESAIADYLIKGKYLLTKTFFENINHLPPGHYLEIDKAGAMLREYWDFHFKPVREMNEEQSAQLLFRAIDESVRDQLMSEVPIGSYLSGGIDSSSVAAAAVQHSNFRMNTFSAVFPGHDGFNEDEFQQEVVCRYNTDHHVNQLTSDNFFTDLQKLIWHIEQPLAGITIGQFQMARFTRQWVTVVLTGHGGDELFGGYPNHLVASALDGFKTQGYGLRAVRSLFLDLKSIANELGWTKIAYNILLFAKPFVFVRELVIKAYERTLMRGMFTREFRRRTRGVFTHGIVFQLLRRSNATTWLDRMLYIDIKLWLHNILVVEDKESMAFSLEDRVPMLDNRVLDLAESIPSEQKISALTLKSIVRKAEAGKLPPALLNHKKMGFPQPIGEWIKEPSLRLKSGTMLLEGELIHRRIIKSGYVRRLIHDHWDAGKDRSFELWQLLCIEMWFAMFVPNSQQRDIKNAV